MGFSFIGNGCFIGGSHIGSKKEALEMLDLAAKKGIKPWRVDYTSRVSFIVLTDLLRIEELPMKDAKKAVEGVKSGKPRYRYVLKQDLATNA